MHRAPPHTRFPRLLALLVALATTGCGFFLPDRIHYEWQPAADAPCPTCQETPAGPAMVALALSGGGSRAAVFSAAVLEVLAERGLAQRLTHLSSVSGGGFAASYFAVNPLSAACPETGGPGDACRRAYFATFREAMGRDFTGAVLDRQFARPGRLTSPTRRASSLQEVLDEAFLGGAAFADLPASPVLLINTASYDDARRFVFSNAVLTDQPADVAPLSVDVLRTDSFSFADCPRPTPPDFPLSLAVAASAAFPPVFGPVTVQATRSCSDATPQYWHLGDGGIIDNRGLDTVRELVVRRVRGGDLARALIFVADAGRALDTQASLDDADLSLFTSNPGAVVDVAQRRAEAYAELFWEHQARDLGIPFDTIVFRYTDARLLRWPDACEDSGAPRGTIAERLAGIPTALDVSACDAALLTAAARQVVDRRLGEAAEVLRRHGFGPAGDVLVSLHEPG